GSNVTGISLRHTELSGKRLQLLKQAFPDARRVAVLIQSNAGEIANRLRATEQAGARLGVQSAVVGQPTTNELRALQPSALSGLDGLVVGPSAMFWNERATILALAAGARVPAVYPEREYADDGGLIAYGANVPHNFRRAAAYVDRVLRGTS